MDEAPLPTRPLEELGDAPTCEAFLRALGQEIREICARAEERFGGLEERQLWWAPAEGRWGVGQCLEHLVRTNDLYLARLRSAAAGLERESSPGEVRVRGGVFGRWFARSVGPGSGWRVPAPRPFRPRDSRSGSGPGGPGEVPTDSVVDEFLEQQDRILGFLDEVRGLPLDRARFSSPVSRLVRFRVTDGLRVVVAHEWRHLAQAERVLGHPRFPD